MKRTDAGQASDLVAQVSAPSFSRREGFESGALGLHPISCGGAPVRSSPVTRGGGQALAPDGAFSWETFLGRRSYENTALLLGSPRPSPASSELSPTRRGAGGVEASIPSCPFGDALGLRHQPCPSRAVEDAWLGRAGKVRACVCACGVPRSCHLVSSERRDRGAESTVPLRTCFESSCRELASAWCRLPRSQGPAQR